MKFRTIFILLILFRYTYSASVKDLELTVTDTTKHSSKAFAHIAYGFQSHVQYILHNQLNSIANYNSRTENDIYISILEQKGPIYFSSVFHLKNRSYLGFSASTEKYSYRVDQKKSNYSFYVRGKTSTILLKYYYQIFTSKELDFYTSVAGGVWYSQNAVSTVVPPSMINKKSSLPFLPFAELALGFRVKFTPRISIIGEGGLGSSTFKVGLCFIQN